MADLPGTFSLVFADHIGYKMGHSGLLARSAQLLVSCCLRPLKGGGTVWGRNNLKHLEQHVNNGGKKTKIIFILTN